ncbi:2-oxo acid dehydrogenase subunit E2 [Streptomyces tanashiensis]
MATAVASDARETRVPIKGVRKATAAAMVGSAFTAPHVTEFVTFDITRTMKLVEELKADKDMAGLRVNPLLLIAKAVLVAVKRNPEINAAWDEAAQEIVLKHYVNLGIAAATPRGLIVPNIKDAHAQTLPELSKSLSELRRHRPRGEDDPGGDAGRHLHHHQRRRLRRRHRYAHPEPRRVRDPLAVGLMQLREPSVPQGQGEAARQVTTLALSFDHRLVDGELGSKFLADIAAILEQPKRLITWA